MIKKDLGALPCCGELFPSCDQHSISESKVAVVSNVRNDRGFKRIFLLFIYILDPAMSTLQCIEEFCAIRST